ncbi:MAG: hypothetical protein FJW31_03470 [Acidobacteria bacterium]|nr:hypothetical protein [Acidobacteriota bacterium]
MASGILQGEYKEYLWNVDAHVGPGCPNKVDDVNRVQMGLVAMSKKGTEPADKAALAGVKLGAPYTGRAADPLTLAIKYIQKRRSGPQDGRASPARYVAMLGEASGTWMITVFARYIRGELKDNWPRLEKWPGCPPALLAASRKMFIDRMDI